WAGGAHATDAEPSWGFADGVPGGSGGVAETHVDGASSGALVSAFPGWPTCPACGPPGCPHQLWRASTPGNTASRSTPPVDVLAYRSLFENADGDAVTTPV